MLAAVSCRVRLSSPSSFTTASSCAVDRTRTLTPAVSLTPGCSSYNLMLR